MLAFSILAYFNVNKRCFLISLLFTFVSSLNQFHSFLFKINKLNLTILGQFLGFYCLSMFIISLTHDVFSISLLFRIVSSSNQIHVPLFMINKVNDALLRQFLDLYILYMLIIRFHTMFSQYHYYLGSFPA